MDGMRGSTDEQMDRRISVGNGNIADQSYSVRKQ